jgi:hypothetical protein
MASLMFYTRNVNVYTNIFTINEYLVRKSSVHCEFSFMLELAGTPKAFWAGFQLDLKNWILMNEIAC